MKPRSSSPRRRMVPAAVVGAALLAGVTWSREASAFCGFYVTGATSNLYANATMVVLMRDGTRTVLSMQNNYDGPPDQFALVIPVPTVLQQGQVQTLTHDVFAHIDALSAPRLVEYWEQDPCAQYAFGGGSNGGGPLATAPGAAEDASAAPQVVIDAQFTVGEFQIVILSADDSSALASWLTQNQYNIPAGAATALAPYVAQGMKFFVAKVDPTKVTFVNGQAALSPLRFYYDSTDFSLPIRLGLLNSQGSQDLIVNILAPNQRYDVANYPNITIPTNIRVRDEVRDDFPGFYEALFQHAISGATPTPVVTEYSWDSQSCDPCPTPPLSLDDLATLGADVTRGLGVTDGGAAGVPAGSSGGGVMYNYPPNYTLTRLHYRYSPQDLGDDLVFEAASPIVGGRDVPDQNGNLSQAVTQNSYSNTFQGRYVILHPWPDALDCANPVRGTWGGPPFGYDGGNGMLGLTNTALTGAPPMQANLAALLAENAAGVTATNPVSPLEPQGKQSSSGCDTVAVSGTGGLWTSLTAIVGFLGIAGLRRPRRGRRG